ncbi:hypothetical protein SELMODRAFT_236291 [Selaginella moellendorffii]|uniref:Probable purine permease n=1 Tax=Selaginella moellendorffii TaxID=88036 RepID=D8T778_SELML|nr:hypothetical protein SELMODRAFT_236291 [Selaginella moellendorffii]
MFVGFIAATLLMRFYYSNGGSRRWLCGWVQTAGWPVCALAMLIVYFKASSSSNSSSSDSPGHHHLLAPFSFKLVAAFASIGCLIALDNFLYSWGMSYLPASTAGLLTSSQLAFNSLFALFLLRKSIGPYVWNSIVLVSSSAVLLGLHSSSDELPGVSREQTGHGYVMTITAAGLYGLILSLTELVFAKVLGRKSTLLVLQMQTSTALVATIVSTVGMAINNDFEAIHVEAAAFKAGSLAYFVTLLCSTLAWQAAFLGTMGVIFLSSSLLAGVILTVVIPVGAVFAYIFFHDAFGGLKVMALLLSCWGFVSYVYGGYVESSAAPPAIPDNKEEHEEYVSSV